MKKKLSHHQSGSRRKTWWFGALAVGLATLSAQAQINPYAVPWFKIAGGGATAPSTGGVYALSGTIGQVDAGRVGTTNIQYRLEGGFWAVAVQQLGFPLLTATRADTNAVLTWVSTETGFIVQSTTNLGFPTVWSDVGSAAWTNGDTNALSIPLNNASRAFFRLRRP
jgi:hypothetical protein